MCHVIPDAAVLVLTVVTSREETPVALPWDLQQEFIRQCLHTKTCREHLYRAVPLEAHNGTNLRQRKCLARSVPRVSDHFQCSLVQLWAARRTALSPRGFCRVQLPKDTDQTAPGMLYAMPSLGLYLHCRKPVSCNCLLTHGRSLTKGDDWLEVWSLICG